MPGSVAIVSKEPLMNVAKGSVIDEWNFGFWFRIEVNNVDPALGNPVMK
jgi:hypothetical protein